MRISKPEKGNLYYINTSDGGYNGARGNPLRLNKDLTSLPNCVMIYGWFNEPGGNGMQYLKAPWYPFTVIQAAKAEGLEVTQDPTVGGIMVWTGGKTGEGHVAGVGKKYDDGSVLTVESEYYGYDWRNYRRRIGDGNWSDGCYWMNSSYVYQGCIKNPFVEEDMTRSETEALIREMFVPLMTEYNESLKKLPADPYAEEALKWAKDEGIMVGDGTNQFPQSGVKREDFAVMQKAIVDKLMDK